MSQAQLPNELATFLETWTTDPNNAKDAFVRFKDFLLTTPDVRFDFKARPGVSYSLRAANARCSCSWTWWTTNPKPAGFPSAFTRIWSTIPMNWATSSRPGSWGRMPAASTLRKMIPPCVTISSPALARPPRPPRNNARNGVSNSPSPIGAGPQCAQRRQAATPSLFSLCGEAIPCRDGVPEWRNAALLL